MDEYNEFYTKPAAVPKSLSTDQIISSPVSNFTSGGLISDLGMNKNGQIVPITGDWRYFDTSLFSRTSNTVVSVKTFNAQNYFSVGDRIYISQGGSDKYFYVVGTSASSLTLCGGDNVVTTDPFVKFAKSNVLSPSGMGSWLQWTAVIKDNDGNDVTPTGLDYSYFVFNYTGGVLTILFNIAWTMGPTGDTYYQIDYPFPITMDFPAGIISGKYRFAMGTQDYYIADLGVKSGVFSVLVDPSDSEYFYIYPEMLAGTTTTFITNQGTFAGSFSFLINNS